MARRQVSIFINGREVANQIKAITAEKRKVTRELALMAVGSEKYNNKIKELQKLNGLVDAHKGKLKGTVDVWAKITSMAKGFLLAQVAALGAREVIQYGAKLFDLGVEMEVLTKKAKVVFGEALPAVEEAAKRNANAMGLTISQYTDAATAIGDLLIPMGFQREEAADISTELVNLSGALSEWTGGQIKAEEVTKILGKAVLGEREQLKTLGISIQEADVKARLQEKGLKNLTGTMLQQAKAAATLELITEKSIDAQTSFTTNSDTLARKQAILSAKVTEVSEKLANTLIPVFHRLVDFAGDVVDVFTSVNDSLLGLTNPVAAAGKAFDDQTQKVKDLETELVPLLERYDELSEKTKPTKEEQTELAKVIQRVGEITPGAITEIDKYGTVLSINAGASRDFLEVEKARLLFVNKESIASIEEQIAGMEGLRALHKKTVDSGRGGLLQVKLDPETIADSRQKVINLSQEIKGATAELNRLKGIAPDKSVSTSKPPPPLSPTAEERAAQAEAAEKLRKEREKQAEERQKSAAKEAKELAKKAEQLEEKILLIKQESAIAQLSEEDQKIAKLAAKYDKQIQLAIELEKKGVATATANRLDLERIKEIALEELRQQLFEEKLAKDSEREATQVAADLEAMHTREEAKKAAEAEINAIIQEEFLTERQLALEELETQQTDLLRLAELHGIDTLDLEIAFRKKKSDTIKQFDEKDRKQLVESQTKQAQLLAQNFQAIGNVVGGVIDALGSKAAKNTALGKVLAIAQIGISSAQAIAQATASAASVPFPGNLVAIGTAVATVLGNIAKAKSIISSVDVPQKKKGRWTNVRGADDGLNYNAKYIGQAPTGMLDYNHPILMASASGPILANEVGQEYFVNHSALRNPHVLNHVRAIDNIVSHRQMVTGGPTIAATTTENPTQNNQENNELAKMTYLVMQQLLQAIPNIKAIITDQTAIDLVERLDKLTKAGGGVLR